MCGRISKLVMLFLLGCSVVTQGAIIHCYSFTDGPTEAVDSVGGMDGTLEGTATISGNQLVLDGGGYVNLPGDVLDHGLTSVTIEAWFEVSAQTEWQRLFAFGETSGNDGGNMIMYCPTSGWPNESRFVMSTTGLPSWMMGEDQVTAPIIPLDTPTYVACVVDGTAGEIRLYQDGALMGTTATTMLLSDVSRQHAYIGSSVYPGDPKLNGSVDEFRIWDVAMTDADVLASYNAGPGCPCEPNCIDPPEDMVAWWTFDEGSGTIADDSAGVINDLGTLINGASFISNGMVDGGLELGGEDDYVEVPNSLELNFGEGNLSVDMWVNLEPNNVNTNIRTIVDKRTIGSSIQGYTVFIGNGILAFELADGIGSNHCGPGASCMNYGSGVTIADGEWYFIAVTVDRGRTDGGIWYVNGVEVGNRFNPTHISGSLTNSAPLWIGRHANWGSSYINGILDEIELYNRVLDANEIRAIFNAGSAGKCKCETGLRLEKKVYDPDTDQWVEQIEADVGTDVRFYVDIINTGTCDLENVTVVDQLPDNIQYTPGGVSEWAHYMTVEGNKLTWDFSKNPPVTIEQGYHLFIQFNGHVVSAGTNENCAVVSATTPEGEFFDEDCATVTVTPPCDANLRLEKKVYDPDTDQWVEQIETDVCTDVRFYVDIINTGTCELEHVTVVDQLPDNIQYTPGGVSEWAHYMTVEGNKLAWDFNKNPPVTIEQGHHLFIQFNGHVVSTGTNENCAVVSATTLEGELSDEDCANVMAIGPVPAYKDDIKWSQPPEKDDCGYINGWDEVSSYYNEPIIADDWLCWDERPIKDIHWWGSFKGWTEQVPPEDMPSAFHIGIWTDIAVDDPDNQAGFSHPRKLVWENICDCYVWSFAARGEGEDDACFKFDQLLSEDQWFYQDPGDSNEGTVYWLSIAAIYDGSLPLNAWGWKTRPHFYNDDAVRIMRPVAFCPNYCEVPDYSEFWAGVCDDFNPPVELAQPSPALAALLANPANFDELEDNHHFGHTITGLPECIVVKAELEITLRGVDSLACNDSINLQLTGGTPRFAWGRRIGTGGSSSYCDGPAGLLGTAWTNGSTWTFVLDLSALPNLTGPPTNLLPLLNSAGHLDVYLQDDTAVDCMILRVWTCPLVSGQWPPVVGSFWENGEPIEYPEGTSWDMAFVLTTNREYEPKRQHWVDDVSRRTDLYPDGIINFKDLAIMASRWAAEADDDDGDWLD